MVMGVVPTHPVSREKSISTSICIVRDLKNMLAAISSSSMDARCLSAQVPIAQLTPPFSYVMDTNTLTTTAQNPSTLSLIAASASDLEALLPGINRHINPNHDVRPDSVVDVRGLNQPAQLGRIPLAETTVHAASQPYLNAPSSKDSLSHTSNGIIQPRKQKVRQKFTDSRRLEVQGIRKKGACIRCRMLRKTVGTSLYLNSGSGLRLMISSAAVKAPAELVWLSQPSVCGSSNALELVSTKNLNSILPVRR